MTAMSSSSKGGGGGVGDPVQALAHPMAGVLGGEQQHGTACGGTVVAQAWDAGGHGDGEVQRQQGFAALGLAADDAHGLLGPQRVHHPLLRLGALLELHRRACREALHRRALLGGASSPQVSRKSFSSSRSRSCSAPAASKPSAMMVSALGLPSA